MSPYLRRVIVIIIALLIPIVPFLIIGEIPGEKWLSRADDNAFIFGLTGASLLTSDIFLPIPSSIIGTFLGARLGILSGWAWIWSGLMVGNLIGFAAGKYLLKSIKIDSWTSRRPLGLPVDPWITKIVTQGTKMEPQGLQNDSFRCKK